jgi:hypothetical protein
MDEALEVVNRALADDAVDELLLGRSGYNYLPKWSSAPGNSDITALLSAFVDGPLKGPSSQQASVRLRAAIERLTPTYEGLLAVASVVLFESLCLKRARGTLGIPLKDVALKLGESIARFKTRLMEDRSGPGRDWEDGMYGELRRLSQNTVALGGPAFASHETSS